jgi:hypothetical protein
VSKEIAKLKFVGVEKVNTADLSVEERNDLWRLKRERQMLEVAEVRAKRIAAELAAEHDENDLMNLQSIKQGESGTVPKRRG